MLLRDQEKEEPKVLTKNDTNQCEDDQLRDNQEGEVPGNNSTVKSRMRQGAHVLRMWIRLRYGHILGVLTWDSHLMMMGKKKPKIPETAGGKTPDKIEKVVSDDDFHFSRKGT